MAVRDILVYPDERLRQVAEPVEVFDDELRRLIDDMAETMYQAPGIGLAAIQVNVPKRVVVIDISEERDGLREFVNPRVVEKQGSLESEEGCLSVPDVYAPVTRAEQVVVEARDRNGEPFTLEAEGLLAVCIQHEIDHLDGKVFVDYLSRLKRDRIRKRLLKHARREPQPASAAAL
ncbi:MAG TPA: peptide deformylase [Arenicellales bacterium]|nr:peptide deformylase [Arenicellales bacterium]